MPIALSYHREAYDREHHPSKTNHLTPSPSTPKSPTSSSKSMYGTAPAHPPFGTMKIKYPQTVGAPSNDKSSMNGWTMGLTLGAAAPLGPNRSSQKNTGGEWVNGETKDKKESTDVLNKAEPALPKKSADDERPQTSALSSSAASPTSPTKSSSGVGMLMVRVVEAKSIPTLPNGKELPYCVLEFDKNEVVVAAKEAGRDTILWQHRAHFDVSREHELAVSIYQRGAGGADILLASVKLRPKFTDGGLQDEWYQSQNFSSDGKEAANGEIHLQIGFKKLGGKHMDIEEFELLKVIGKGSFGKVMQVRKKDTSRIYAMKILKKSHIVERSEVSHTLAERTVLAQINHPFIVPLKFSFQSPEKLYLVLAFVNGGELFHHLQREGRFSEDRARFYTAELLCALECLHGYNIIYRDLKPENILLDYTGHIALCDFGLCKLDMKQGAKTNTFCGTPEYLAPELLLGQGYTKAVDWWTLGILLYEMLTGLPPFYDENTNEMYRKILIDELRFPDDIGSQAKDLLKGLLNRDPNERLGNEGPEAIKNHPFFADINWSKLMARKYQPPFKPNVASATDTSNFDEEFTSEAPTDSVTETSHLSETVQQQFAGFTFQAHAEHMAGSVVAGSLMTNGMPRGKEVAGSFRPTTRVGRGV
ncbi:hypothetical protein SmJEL517_g03615 [Synchytrium microbalum]|uniref:non-specific serine/threonine protein kinase n=1 Tax=Synchytrium microbalum TaxID=1806994 RepID=A0A507C193_9FUNG|nr:uncharacterized protein SmJEL517_g03615 [Synchytrium microbalum]TPX33472.1 hypothetical protein SmJEL517_g03615 [Synchytrium microbalum]